MNQDSESRSLRVEQAPAKRLILLEDLDEAVADVTGGASKMYFGESQFDA